MRRHYAPHFLCLPGCKKYGKEALQNNAVSGDWNEPKFWPFDTTLRVKIMSGESTYPVIVSIIKGVGEEWLKDVRAYKLQWVDSSEAADIRITFHTDEPNWSCLGTMAQRYDPSKPTMNFSFGEWLGNKHAVYSQVYIYRVAAHLFGHAFGFPHALWPTGSVIDTAKVANWCGDYFAGIAKAERGWPGLQRADSIMHCDRSEVLYPNASLGTEPQGGLWIDDESRNILKKMVLPIVDVWCERLELYNMTDFPRDSNKCGASGSVTINTHCNNRAVTGLSLIDMCLLPRNFRAYADVQPVLTGTPGLRLQLGSWGDSLLWNSAATVLGIDAADTRFKCGTVTWSEMKADNQSWMIFGDCLKWVNFGSFYNKEPKVIAWIRQFKSSDQFPLEYLMHTAVAVKEIQKGSFLLAAKAMERPIDFDMIISWIAYDSDEKSVRSGNFDHPVHLPGTPPVQEDKMFQRYSSDMVYRPRRMFTAFTEISAPTTNNIRLRCDTPTWDEKGVNGEVKTWGGSQYYVIRHCYLAIL